MTIQEITEKAEIVSAKYSDEFGVQYTSDWFLLKLQEEFGEIARAHLMLTDRTRRKIASTEDGKRALADEIADVFAYTLLFAKQMDIDVEEAFMHKWGAYIA